MNQMKVLLQDEITNVREASKRLYEKVRERYSNDVDMMLLTSVLEDAAQNAFDIVFND